MIKQENTAYQITNNLITYPFPCDEQLASLEEIQGIHVGDAQTSCETFSPCFTYGKHQQL